MNTLDTLCIVLDFFCFFGSEIFTGIFMLLFLLLTSGVFKNWVRTYIYGENTFFFTSYDIYSFYVLTLIFIFITTCNSEYYSFSAFDALYLFENSVGSTYLKQIILSLMFFSSFSIFRAAELVHIHFQEIVFLLFGCLLSSMLLAMSTSLISVFLCLEFLGLCFYTLAAILRSVHSVDAGLHYFIANALVSGCFLAGCTILYGHFGTFDFCSLDTFFCFLLNGKEDGISIVAFGCLLIFLSFAFKLLAAPFQLWQPFVYFGSPVAATIIFCVISKLVIFTPLLRISVLAISAYPYFVNFFLFLGFFTFIYGGVRAFFTNKLKFVLIYSSMNQVGVPICLVGFNTESAFVLIYFFVIIYSLVSIVAWIAYVQLLTQQYKVNEYKVITEPTLNRAFHEHIFKYKPNDKQLARELSSPLFLSSLSGLWFINRSLALKFIFVFFSFAGIPPLVGFLTKSFIFYGILEMYSFLWIVVFVFFGSFTVIYYLRLIKIIFDEPSWYEYTNPNKIISFSFLELFESKVEDGLCLLVTVFILVLLFNSDVVMSFGYWPVYYLFFNF